MVRYILAKREKKKCAHLPRDHKHSLFLSRIRTTKEIASGKIEELKERQKRASVIIPPRAQMIKGIRRGAEKVETLRAHGERKVSYTRTHGANERVD